MSKQLKIIQKSTTQSANRRSAKMTDSELRLAAARMTKEIEEKAQRRARGELTPEDDVEVIVEWL